MDLLHYNSDEESSHESHSHHTVDDHTESNHCIKSSEYSNNELVSSKNKPDADNNQNKYKFLESYLPPLIQENVDPETIENIRDYKLRGADLTETLRANKQFGNPYILTKVVKTLGIDEIGSNFPKKIFDPHSYEESDFCDSVMSRGNKKDTSNTLPICNEVQTSTAVTLNNNPSLNIDIKNIVQQINAHIKSTDTTINMTTEVQKDSFRHEHQHKKKSRWDSQQI